MLSRLSGQPANIDSPPLLSGLAKQDHCDESSRFLSALDDMHMR